MLFLLQVCLFYCRIIQIFSLCFGFCTLFLRKRPFYALCQPEGCVLIMISLISFKHHRNLPFPVQGAQFLHAVLALPKVGIFRPRLPVSDGEVHRLRSSAKILFFHIIRKPRIPDGCRRCHHAVKYSRPMWGIERKQARHGISGYDTGGHIPQFFLRIGHNLPCEKIQIFVRFSAKSLPFAITAP